VTADKPGNIANLQAAGAARTAAAAARAEAALDRMTRSKDPITFRGLAAAAGVSLDFLYRHTALRDRIAYLRDRQRTVPATTARPAAAPGGTVQVSNVVAALTAQLAEARRRHREETTALRQALEAAHGENLLLRRSLGSHAGSDDPA
jgi:hypothetical protein